MKGFRQFILASENNKEYSTIPEFNDYNFKSNQEKNDKIPKNSQKIPDFNDYDFVSQHKKDSIKESIKWLIESGDWSHLTQHIRDNSLEQMGLDPKENEFSMHDIGLNKERNEGRGDLIDKLKLHHNNFTPDHIKTIKRFTADSWPLNNYLMNKKSFKPNPFLQNDTKENHEKFNENLLSVINHHPKYPEGHYVLSGIGTKLNNDPLKPVRENGVVKHKIWVSSSPNHTIARSFSGTDSNGHNNLTRIYIPGANETLSKNSPSVPFIGHHSLLSSEDESLIPPGHVIYHPKPTIIKSKYSDNIFHMYHGVYVPRNTALEIHKKIQNIKNGVE